MIRSRMEASAPLDLANSAGCVRWRHTRRCSRALARSVAVLFLLLIAVWSQAAGAQSPAPDAAQRSDTSPSAAKAAATPVSDADVARLRAETLARLNTIAPGPGADPAPSIGTTPSGTASLPVAAPGARKGDASTGASTAAAATSISAANKPLYDLFNERLRWLDEFDKLTVRLAKTTNPEPSPERQAEEAKTELHQLQATLAEAAKSPEVLLPPFLRAASAKVTSALSAEMKDALDSTADELKEWKAKLESTKDEAAKSESLQTARRLHRDELFQKLANRKAKSEEYEGAVADAQSASARRLAQERLINFQWETKVETLRLRLVEAEIALETKLVSLRELNMHVDYSHVLIIEQTQKLIRARYKVAAENYERDLNSAAAKEESKARRTDDPLERFRAWRTAELLVLESLVMKGEQALATSPAPSLEEQRTLADRAEADFARIKELLVDGKVSRLDAMRLNNEFRRIGPERDGLLKSEMAMVESQLQFYENALTSVEIELLQDSSHDRFEHDLVHERLPKQRWDEGEALLTELEHRHRSLLVRRRIALEKLTDRAAHTLQQVSRRLSILDEEYGFIRTTIFWVRDQDPIGLPTLAQTGRELNYLVRGFWRLAAETVKPALWGRLSAEFLVAMLGVLAFPFAFMRLRRVLAALIDQSKHRALRTLALELIRAALWPLYLVLLAYVARVGPWPRSLGILVSAILTAMAVALFFHELLRWMAWPEGWGEQQLEIPRPVARQLGRAGRFIVGAAVALVLPIYIFDHELIAPEGRPLAAPALSRFLMIGFELVVWCVCARLVRGRSALWDWLATAVQSAANGSAPAPAESSQVDAVRAQRVASAAAAGSARAMAGLLWLARKRRVLSCVILAAVAVIILLDVRGYSFTARRLAAGGWQTTVVILLAVAAYRSIGRAISANGWRWAGPRRSWAMALTSAVARHAAARSRGTTIDPDAEPAGTAELDDPADDVGPLHDLVTGLRRLGAGLVIVLSIWATAWIWEVDLALVQFLLAQPLWGADSQAPVTLGNAIEATFVILLGTLAWRYMSTLFAVTIFPRMPDDPGVRFAVVTLCRYAALGLTALIALGAVHLDLAKIGVVLAALGVGLGFGLQEIVSNFVCGIILLLERPIRIGDVVTVAGTTGKVDRINIRATTIVNSDNQSMIVPNREFITGNLVNWTLKDKILRVPIKISVAYGTDPDSVVELLLQIAGADSDVMLNPGPSASLEGFGDSSLLFALYTFVAEPGLAGGVRHRLCAEIQRRFAAEQIVMPFPTQELHLGRVPFELAQALTAPRDESVPGQVHRVDSTTKTPPPPHGPGASLEVDELAKRRTNR
jgi:small-conductance mechanosensitive channel